MVISIWEKLTQEVLSDSCGAIQATPFACAVYTLGMLGKRVATWKGNNRERFRFCSVDFSQCTEIDANPSCQKCYVYTRLTQIDRFALNFSRFYPSLGNSMSQKSCQKCFIYARSTEIGKFALNLNLLNQYFCWFTQFWVGVDELCFDSWKEP